VNITRMVEAAANAVVHQASELTGTALPTDVGDRRTVSATVAEAVYHAAVEDDAVDYRCPWSVPRVTRTVR
jgi:hypothetical protein